MKSGKRMGLVVGFIVCLMVPFLAFGQQKVD